MGAKRKFTEDLDDATGHMHSAKQMKLFPFPSSEPESDIAMSDCSAMDVEFSPFHVHARRLSSSASTGSTASTDSEFAWNAYPHLDIYPASYGSSAPLRSESPKPSMSGLQFVHYRSDCKQIPKLRVACEAGPGGQRSMWALCEECGRIEMIDS